MWRPTSVSTTIVTDGLLQSVVADGLVCYLANLSYVVMDDMDRAAQRTVSRMPAHSQPQCSPLQAGEWRRG
jgi:hypothetical protein